MKSLKKKDIFYIIFFLVLSGFGFKFFYQRKGMLEDILIKKNETVEHSESVIKEDEVTKHSEPIIEEDEIIRHSESVTEKDGKIIVKIKRSELILGRYVDSGWRISDFRKSLPERNMVIFSTSEGYFDIIVNTVTGEQISCRSHSTPVFNQKGDRFFVIFSPCCSTDGSYETVIYTIKNDSFIKEGEFDFLAKEWIADDELKGLFFEKQEGGEGLNAYYFFKKYDMISEFVEEKNKWFLIEKKFAGETEKYLY